MLLGGGDVHVGPALASLAGVEGGGVQQLIVQLLSSHAVSMEQLAEITNHLGSEMSSAKCFSSNHTLDCLADLADNPDVLPSVVLSGALEVLHGDVHPENQIQVHVIVRGLGIFLGFLDLQYLYQQEIQGWTSCPSQEKMPNNRITFLPQKLCLSALNFLFIQAACLRWFTR